MNIATLIKMANQIGAEMEHSAPTTELSNTICGHLNRFWEPRMRLAIFNFVTENPDNTKPLSKCVDK